MTNFISTNEVIQAQNCVYCQNPLADKSEVIEILELTAKGNEKLVYACCQHCEDGYYIAMEDAYELERLRNDPYSDFLPL